jgi:hypothetical protein
MWLANSLHIAEHRNIKGRSWEESVARQGSHSIQSDHSLEHLSFKVQSKA